MEEAAPFPARHKPTTHGPDTPLNVLAEALMGRPETRSVHIVDDAARPLGIVTLGRLIELLAARVGALERDNRHSASEIVSLLGAKKAADVMIPVRPFKAGSSLKEALRLLDSQEAQELPVVDEKGAIVGEIRGSDLLEKAGDLFKGESG